MSWFLDRGRPRATSPILRVLFPSAVIALAAAVLCTVGCRKPADSAQDISIQESIAPQPVRAGEATVSIRLANALGQQLSHARIQVEGDMDHPGMAPVFGDAKEIAPGSYQAPIAFSMGGDWTVLLHITLADGRKIEREWNVKGVQSR